MDILTIVTADLPDMTFHWWSGCAALFSQVWKSKFKETVPTWWQL